MNFFIIPGNPPAVHFYELWKTEISRAMPGTLVEVSAYTSPSPGQKSKDAMNHVVNSHSNKLLELYEKSRSPIVVLGHSLGGYVALELLKRHAEIIEQVFLIHPFLRAPDTRGMSILKLATLIRNFQIIPSLIFRYRSFLENKISDLKGVTDQELLMSLEIAFHESQTIAQDQSEIEIKKNLAPKIKVFFTQNDTWCTAKVIESLRQQVFTQECLQPHGFITSKRHRQDLIETISKALKPL